MKNHVRVLMRSLAVFFAICQISCFSSANESIKDLVESPNRKEEEIIENAKNTYDRGLYTRSREEWSALKDSYPASRFLPLAQLRIADCYFAVDDYKEAASAYQEYLRFFASSDMASYAQYRLAESYFSQYSGVKKDQQPLKDSIKFYQQVLDNYPQSQYAQVAIERISKIRDLMSAYNDYVASFYAKKGNLKAVKARKISN